VEIDEKRAGVYVNQRGNYRAFIPKILPPDPPIMIDDELADMLSKANRALGRLDGSAEILPNPDLFVAMYVRKESIISSQIEGTQASLEDVLAYEAISERRRLSTNIAEVVNHVSAMNKGIARLQSLHVGTRLLKELHAELLKDVRGREKHPGQFRRTQNWIGAPSCDLSTATFVPPPAAQVEKSMSNLEAYLADQMDTPLLIKCGVAHAQFETIHPFLDGNGRLGRLLVTLYLCQKQVLSRPLLYVSAYYKQHRGEYYDRLQRVRDTGDWEGWLKFFLRGIWQVSEEAFRMAKQIIATREEHRRFILQGVTSSSKALVLLDHLFESPMINVNDVSQLLKISYTAANNVVHDLLEAGLLKESTGKQRNRRFVYEPYLAILREGTEPISP
jgi:Fic family protein